MAKLERYNKVAVVKYGCTPYFFAIYDDENDYKAGDLCVFSGNSTPARLEEVISVEEASKRTSKNITAEVIGKVDTTAYDKRVESRKEKEKLKKEMEKRKKEIKDKLDDEYYAKQDDLYAALLIKYKSLGE